MARLTLGVALSFALLAACGGEPDDPQLAAVGEAVATWRLGRAALDADEPERAARYFAEARQRRPNDGLLAAWEAEAWQAAGDVDRALAALDDAARLAPRLGTARFRRARLLAQRGEPKRAAADLRRALDLGATTPRSVAAQPDLLALREQPGLGELPELPVEVRFSMPTQSAFLGSEVQLVLEVERAGDAPVEVEAKVRGPVRLTRVIEDESQLVSGDQRWRLTWRLRIEGQGEVVVDGLTVRVQGEAHRVDGGRFAAEAPDRPGLAEPQDVPLDVPSARVAGRVAPQVWVDGARVLALVDPADRLRTDPEVVPRWRDVIRRDGADVSVLYHLPQTEGLQVVVVGDAAVRLRWPEPAHPAE